MMNSLKDMVNNNQRVFFRFYRDSNLWYTTECGFEFPVPISDIGNATFLYEDRAILFMRYIRKHMEFVSAAKKAVCEVSSQEDGTVTSLNKIYSQLAGQEGLGKRVVQRTIEECEL